MADVGATLVSWSSTDSSNSPSGSTSIGTGLDDNLRALQGVVVRGLSHKGADIASAATTDLGAVEGLMHDITGTQTISSFGTVRAGILKVIKFEGALTLTHNATTLILPGGANITTADGDVAIVISEGSGNWRCLSYVPASGYALKQVAASDTVAGVVEYAVQSEMETGTSNVLAVTPGRQQFHASAAKAFTNFNGTGTIAARRLYNVSSINDNGDGDYTVNFSTAFSAADYSWAVDAGGGVGGSDFDTRGPDQADPTGSAFRFSVLGGAQLSRLDAAWISAVFYGDQ